MDFKKYYYLTKPGIIYGNTITATAGFLLASKGHIKYGLLLATLAGTSFIIASACVFNNYIDRHLDKKMARTKNRALVKGTITAQKALSFAAILGILGVFVLTYYTNLLTLTIGLTAFFIYVVLYGITKRQSTTGTLIGSLAGAAPPLAGYTAVSNHLDAGAILLFLILVIWQMPHFYAIAIYRLEDYATAGLPVLPIKRGITQTKIHMLLYILSFIISTLLLTIFGYTGYPFFTIAALLGLIWLWLSLQGFKTKNNKTWSRKMFIFSLIILILLCLMIPIDQITSPFIKGI